MGTNGIEGEWDVMPTLLAAAHELKSPLVLIRQLALQLEDQASTKELERIRLTAERSLQLVENLTRASRLQDTMFASEPINVAALLEDVAQDMMPLARALGSKIELCLPTRSPIALGNRQLLRSVLLGLCDNALTHNDRHHPIVLTAQRRGEWVISSVRDFGPATSTLRAMRRQLGTTPQPVAARPRSSGLGLLIAEQFARHMDGQLLLRRHRQAGATFMIELPASQQLSLLSL